MKFRITVAEAVKAVERNLDLHVQELKEAVEVWSKELQQALHAAARAIDRLGLEAKTDELTQLIRQRPIDTRPQYSKYLGALKRSVDPTIEIDENDYDRIFNDNWEWRSHSKALNNTYAAKH